MARSAVVGRLAALLGFSAVLSLAASDMMVPELPERVARFRGPSHEIKKDVMKAEELDSDSLALRLAGPGPVTFVMFSAPWCEQCLDVQPAWDLLSRHYDYRAGVRVVSVDCTMLGERACALHGILLYPAILAFPHKKSSAHTTRGLPFPGDDMGSVHEMQAWFTSLVPELKQHHVHASRSPIEPIMGSAAAAVDNGVLLHDSGGSGGRPQNWTRSLPGGPNWLGLISFESDASAAAAADAPSGALGVSARGTWRSGCEAWRQSADCDPEGPHAPERDLSCLQPVLGNRGGYCDCGGGRREKLVDCGSEHRKAFTCLDQCAPVSEDVCEGFKATSGCLAGGTGDGGRGRQSPFREDTRNNQDCRKVIPAEWSGRCDCGGGLGPAFNCSHAPFTCLGECLRFHAERKAAEAEVERRRAEKRRDRIERRKTTPVISIEEEEAAAREKQQEEEAAKEQERQKKLEAEKAQEEKKRKLEALKQKSEEREMEVKRKLADLQKKRLEREMETKRKIDALTQKNGDSAAGGQLTAKEFDEL